MNLVDVAQELSDQLAMILSGRATPYAPDTVQPPAGYVFGPDTTYDASYGRGLDTVTLSVTVVVARQPIDQAWKQVSAFVSGSGERSVKTVLEAGTYRSFSTIQVTGSRAAEASIAGVDYKAAVFDITITGSGA